MERLFDVLLREQPFLTRGTEPAPITLHLNGATTREGNLVRLEFSRLQMVATVKIDHEELSLQVDTSNFESVREDGTAIRVRYRATEGKSHTLILYPRDPRVQSRSPRPASAPVSRR